MELSESVVSVPQNSHSISDNNNEIDQVQQQLNYSEIGSQHSIPETNDTRHQQQNHSADLEVLHSSPDPDAAAPSDLDQAVVDQIQKLDLKGDDDVEAVVEEKKEKGEEFQEVEAEKSYNGRETENGNESERHSEEGEEENNEGEDKSENGAEVEKKDLKGGDDVEAVVEEKKEKGGEFQEVEAEQSYNGRETENGNESERHSEEGEEENNEGEDKSENGAEVEKKGEESNRRYQYPVRPEAEDCSFYLKTGNCKFGPNCKFNHPVRRKNNQVFKDKVKERDELAEKPGQTECKYYLRPGGCKYGKACRYNHGKGKPTVASVVELNFLGLPIRQGERECPYYMRNGSCKYGSNCRFNHPDPTAARGSDPPSGFDNGGPASLQGGSQSSSWSAPRSLSETPLYVPMMMPPSQGVHSQNTEWNSYQAPMYVGGTETNVYKQYPLPNQVDEFPERPGQPVCSFFLRTGDCKFKSNCKYHHPKSQTAVSPSFALSDKGLPLRPDQNICTHYSRYGICKFGPACKFDHPLHLTSPTTSGLDHQLPFSDLANIKEAGIARSRSGTDDTIQL